MVTDSESLEKSTFPVSVPTGVTYTRGCFLQSGYCEETTYKSVETIAKRCDRILSVFKIFFFFFHNHSIYSARRIRDFDFVYLSLVTGGFLGDIALPNVKYETEWRQQKLNKTYLEELEKYQDEVLKEGLQIEEEGLTGQ